MRADIFFGGGLPDPSLRPDLDGLLGEVLRQEPDAFSYGGGWGFSGLRDLVAERLSRRSGAELTAGNVVLTNGSAGALELVAAHLIRPGIMVAVEALTYPGAVGIFRKLGARIVTVPVDENGMDVLALAALFERPSPRDRPSIVYTIATCHSPTGTTMSLPRRRQLARLADHYQLRIVQDDTYGEIRFSHDSTPPLVGMDPDRVVHVGSFSKTLAPRLRLGWLAARADTCQAIVEHRTDLGNAPVIQRAVARFCAGDAFSQRLSIVSAIYRDKRDRLLAALDHYCADAGDWRIPGGGFFVWLGLRHVDVDVLEPLAAAEGVRYLGGPYFSADRVERHGLRLAYGELPVEALEEGIHRLSRALARAGNLPDADAAAAPLPAEQ